MKAQKFKDRPKLTARVATSSDIDQAIALDHVFPNQECRQSFRYLDERISKCRGCVFVLEDEDGKICGRTECLPLEPEILAQLTRDKQPLENSLINKFLLSPKKALERAVSEECSGNILFVGMVAIDPVTGKEACDQAGPLFTAVYGKLREFRMSAVIARSYSNAAETVLHSTGTVQIASHKVMKVWFFDGNVAAHNRGAGLSVVYYTMWADGSSTGSIKFTKLHRRIMAVSVLQHIYEAKELAPLFNVEVSTMVEHKKNMIQKAKESESKIFGDRQIRFDELVAYCNEHPVEYVLPLEKPISGTGLLPLKGDRK